MTEEIKIDAPCLHLRSKDQFYKHPTAADQEHAALVARLYGAVDTRAHWCQCTQTGRGPDDQPVNQGECSKAGRKCYTGLDHLA